MSLVPNSRLVDSRTLQDWCNAIFAAAGMPAGDARTAAEVLVRTSLRGVDTHGVSRAPLYAEALLAGTSNPKPDHGGEYRDGILHYRGDRGLGQVIGAAATRQAIGIAREVPVVTCLMQQCGHLAALGAYVLLAAEEGMFALIGQATTPLMGLPGWKGRGMGNNPLAFATPVPGKPPLVFDMASSVVARGHLREAVREKVSIPEGWAIGPDGEPTTDPEVGMAGAVLPFGGYKGLGVAMLVQCLAGSLIGNSATMANAGGSEMGAFLLVINPKLAVGDGYATDVAVWFDRYMAAAGPDGRYPGRRAAESEVERRRDGIPVAPGSWEQMRAISERLGVPLTF
ncbi:MAG TPA: Ldh family oxidoreductase [Geminicoccaceae bacterium]|nr:Ldh family oxidoreductase [Geminicoccus sp.]HMU49659.1 Ldh family oxidoreductase [Geminicoccaceae bacterium]